MNSTQKYDEQTSYSTTIQTMHIHRVIGDIETYLKLIITDESMCLAVIDTNRIAFTLIADMSNIPNDSLIAAILLIGKQCVVISAILANAVRSGLGASGIKDMMVFVCNLLKNLKLRSVG